MVLDEEKRDCLLVVDDNPQNLEVLINGLTGYEISAALSGDEALGLLESLKPDLILLDVMMPGKDGFETCRAMKEIEAHKDVPVIFLTALSDVDSKLRGFESGGVDYVSKPIQLRELQARVTAHLTLRRQRLELIAQKEELERKNKIIMEQAQQLDRMARLDPLTQLPNRRDFQEKVRAEEDRFARSQRSFTVILGDIDHFKRFNDEHGHDCGDRVLKLVAKLIRAQLRDQDIVARWGGEEFILLLPETDTGGAKTVAENIRLAVSQAEFLFDDTPLKITMTFGLCLFDGTLTLDECINQADAALYKGKETGRNRVMTAG